MHVAPLAATIITHVAADISTKTLLFSVQRRVNWIGLVDVFITDPVISNSVCLGIRWWVANETCASCLNCSRAQEELDR